MFEFTLDYGSRGYISWQQNSNPIKVNKKETNSTEIGLKITSNKNNFGSFNGLMMSATSNSYIDGYSGALNDFWYSVGTRSFYQNEKEKIPGRGVVDEFSLWLRIPPKICTCKNQYRQINVLVCFYIFITRSC